MADIGTGQWVGLQAAAARVPWAQSVGGRFDPYTAYQHRQGLSAQVLGPCLTLCLKRAEGAQGPAALLLAGDWPSRQVRVNAAPSARTSNLLLQATRPR